MYPSALFIVSQEYYLKQTMLTFIKYSLYVILINIADIILGS